MCAAELRALVPGAAYKLHELRGVLVLGGLAALHGVYAGGSDGRDGGAAAARAAKPPA